MGRENYQKNHQKKEEKKKLNFIGTKVTQKLKNSKKA